MNSKWALSRERWLLEGPDIIRRTQNIGIVSPGIVTIHRESELNFSPITNVGDGSWSCQNGLRDVGPRQRGLNRRQRAASVMASHTCIPGAPRHCRVRRHICC
jgi:hypothetical protein